MPSETWIRFALIHAACSAISGPSVLAVVGQPLTRGFPNGLRCIADDLAGGVLC